MHVHIVKMYKDKEVNKNVKNIFLSMCDVKLFLTFTSLNLVLLWQLFYQKYFWHFCWLPYLYTFSLCEHASFIIVSAETEYISTSSWYRNINFLRDRIRRMFVSLSKVTMTIMERQLFRMSMHLCSHLVLLGFVLLNVYVYVFYV
jgi:hypothetical protein